MRCRRLSFTLAASAAAAAGAAVPGPFGTFRPSFMLPPSPVLSSQWPRRLGFSSPVELPSVRFRSTSTLTSITAHASSPTAPAFVFSGHGAVFGSRGSLGAFAGGVWSASAVNAFGASLSASNVTRTLGSTTATGATRKSFNSANVFTPPASSLSLFGFGAAQQQQHQHSQLFPQQQQQQQRASFSPSFHTANASAAPASVALVPLFPLSAPAPLPTVTTVSTYANGSAVSGGAVGGGFGYNSTAAQQSLSRLQSSANSGYPHHHHQQQSVYTAPLVPGLAAGAAAPAATPAHSAHSAARTAVLPVSRFGSPATSATYSPARSASTHQQRNSSHDHDHSLSLSHGHGSSPRFALNSFASDATDAAIVPLDIASSGQRQNQSQRRVSLNAPSTTLLAPLPVPALIPALAAAPAQLLLTGTQTPPKSQRLAPQDVHTKLLQSPLPEFTLL
mgnify:CR=1 FL=1